LAHRLDGLDEVDRFLEIAVATQVVALEPIIEGALARPPKIPASHQKSPKDINSY
jgi:hypothetical protein